MKIKVCIPSYRRPKVKTLEYLPFASVYVDVGEYDEYKKENPDADIISCPEGIQGSVSRVRNYIITKELKNNDVVVMLDDDMSGLYFWEAKKSHKIPTDMFLAVVAKYSLIAKEFGAYFWGVNINQDKQVYREYTPFSTTSFVGGPFQCFLKGNNCLYDEALPLKEDYDMTLQQLNKNRVVLRVNKFFYMVKQAEQAGGCAVYRNFDAEMLQLKLLQKKWGKQIVKIDNNERSHNLKKTKKKIDFNPIISAPIKGV